MVGISVEGIQFDCTAEFGNGLVYIAPAHVHVAQVVVCFGIRWSRFCGGDPESIGCAEIVIPDDCPGSQCQYPGGSCQICAVTETLGVKGSQYYGTGGHDGRDS